MSSQVRFPFAVGKYAFDWEDAHLNAPKYDSPIPCTHGTNCFYHGKMGSNGTWNEDYCRRVHPGEEGSGRKIFHARYRGEQDKARLLPFPGEQRASFYDRTFRKMTWPQYCEYRGWPVPKRPSATIEDENLTINIGPDDEEELADVPVIQGVITRQSLGEAIYIALDAMFVDPAVRQVMYATGWTTPNITTAKVVGMMMDASPTLNELAKFLTSKSYFYETVMDCCEVLQEDHNDKQIRNPLSFENCNIKPGMLWGDSMI
jgi:hypothetical protein